ncbi:repeat protein [Moumouvirus goulette]|uniref:Repeat protein n=1 Tax=Moumouvirus goulette TaxID=1247379 RepID=M1PXW1_9VIRU|nr:repeat protein [Moumouvirus goulette]AGF85617.1 repeat protein [Moumouvirus goulette]
MYFLLSQKSGSYNIIDINYVFKKLYSSYDLSHDSELVQVEPNTTHPDFIIKEIFPGEFITNHINIITKYNKNDISTITMLIDQKIELGYKKLYKWTLQNDRIDIIKLLHSLSIPINKYSSCENLFQYINKQCLNYISINNDFFNFNLENLLLTHVKLFNKTFKINNDATIILNYMFENNLKFNHDKIFTYAAKYDYLPVIIIMIENGIEPDNNLITIALKNSASRVFEYLYELGFHDGVNKIIKYCMDPQILEYLLKYEDIDENILIELLNDSCVKNNKEMVKFIIKKGIDINVVTEQTVNKFIINSRIIDFFIKKSDKITDYVVNNYPEILSNLMVGRCKKSVIKLIKNGINYNHSEIISSAICMNDLDVFKLLMSNSPNNFEITKSDLSFLCKYGNLENLQYIIKNGPKIDLQYCLKKATFYKNNEIGKYLLDIVDYSDSMGKIIIDHFYNFGEVYFLSDITKPFICSPLQEIIIEIIRGNTSNVKNLILDYGLNKNLEIAFASCLVKNINLIDFLIDCNEDIEYVNWLFIFSANNMTILQHLLKKINLESITRANEAMIYAKTCYNHDIINYLNMLGYKNSSRFIEEEDLKIIKELPIIKFLTEIDLFY